MKQSGTIYVHVWNTLLLPAAYVAVESFSCSGLFVVGRGGGTHLQKNKKAMHHQYCLNTSERVSLTVKMLAHHYLPLPVIMIKGSVRHLWRVSPCISTNIEILQLYSFFTYKPKHSILRYNIKPGTKLRRCLQISNTPERKNIVSRHSKYVPLSQAQTKSWIEDCHDPSP